VQWRRRFSPVLPVGASGNSFESPGRHPEPAKGSVKSRLRLAAIGYGLAGVLALVLLSIFGEFPPWATWIPFAIAVAWLEWHSVEVNQGVGASPSVMVILTAAVVFGDRQAALGVALLAALESVTRHDLAQRHWMQPVVNFGQFTISAAAAGLLVDFMLPSTALDSSQLGWVALAGGLAAMLYALLNMGLVSLAVHRIFRRPNPRPWVGLAHLIPSYLTMGFLGGLLGATYRLVGPATLVPIFAVFFVAYLNLASLGSLRQAHEATLRAFIKSLEAKDRYTRGHTERVAGLAQAVARQLGFRREQLDRVRIAALIHDVGKLSVPVALIRKPGRLSENEYTKMQEHADMVEHLLEEVEFLAPMVKMASAHHVHFDGSGYGHHTHSEGPPALESRILAVADAYDAMTSTRSYRVALSQRYAFAELRKNSGNQFDPVVVEALIAVLPVEQGSTVSDESEARRQAEATAEEKKVAHG